MESSWLRPLTGACLETATGDTDDSRRIRHDSPMNSQATFVAKRLEAHVAGTRDVFSDPLVTVALSDHAIAVEIVARWKALRETPVPPAATIDSEYHYKGGLRRQAE